MGTYFQRERIICALGVFTFYLVTVLISKFLKSFSYSKCLLPRKWHLVNKIKTNCKVIYRLFFENYEEDILLR
jgi:hypothetical protein